MNIYLDFLDEKTLATILLVLRVNNDLKQLIIEKIILKLLDEEFAIYDYPRIFQKDEFDYSDYYLSD